MKMMKNSNEIEEEGKYCPLPFSAKWMSPLPGAVDLAARMRAGRKPWSGGLHCMHSLWDNCFALFALSLYSHQCPQIFLLIKPLPPNILLFCCEWVVPSDQWSYVCLYMNTFTTVAIDVSVSSGELRRNWQSLKRSPCIALIFCLWLAEKSHSLPSMPCLPPNWCLPTWRTNKCLSWYCVNDPFLIMTEARTLMMMWPCQPWIQITLVVMMMWFNNSSMPSHYSLLDCFFLPPQG